MLDTARSRIWEAMQIGPQWLLRDTEDPLLDEMTKKRLAPAPVRGAAVRPDAPPNSTEVPAARVAPTRAPVTHRASRAGAAPQDLVDLMHCRCGDHFVLIHISGAQCHPHFSHGILHCMNSCVF